MALKLRPYQLQLIEESRQEFQNKAQGLLIVLPTGGGKTVIMSAITQGAISKNKKVLILQHRIELIMQASLTLRHDGIEHGIFAAGNPETIGARTVIASIQTLISRLNKYIANYGEPDMILMDEAHHSRASQWETIKNAFPRAKIVGVTATPERTDGKGLGRQSGGAFDKMIMGPSVQQLINMGFLVPPKVYCPKEVLGKALVGDFVQSWQSKGNNQPTVAFCKSVEHAEQVAAVFNAYGIPAASVDGKMDIDKRTSIINSLKDGSIKVLTSCDVISEGVDIPIIGCVMLLRKLSSLVVYFQQIGRALRIKDGKTEAIVLDHAGNTLRHGFVTDDWEWSLSGKEERKRISSKVSLMVKQCSGCYTVFNPQENSTCPQCGVKSEPVKKTKTVYKDGVLVELTKEDLNQFRKYREDKIRAARTLEQLKIVAKEFGYDHIWAQNIYQIRLKKQSQSKAKNENIKIIKDATNLILNYFSTPNPKFNPIIVEIAKLVVKGDSMLLREQCTTAQGQEIAKCNIESFLCNKIEKPATKQYLKRMIKTFANS